MAYKLNIPLPSKGLMVDRPSEYIDQRSPSAVHDMEVNRAIIRKRKGSSALGATLSERIQRYFELVVGSETRLFRVGLTGVQVLNKTLSTWASVATAALTGTAADPVDFAFPILSGERIVVYTNGVDNIRKCSITGNDADLGGSPPKCKFLVADEEYLLLLNITDGGNDYPMRVQWPDTANPESWTPGSGSNAGSADLLDDSDKITGGGRFGGFVTVHTQRSIWLGQRVSTSAVYRFDRLSTGVGACTGATICSLPSGEQIFLATDGIHVFNGVTAPPIDSPIQDELRESLNPEYLHAAQGIFVEELDEYWICVAMGSDTVPQTVYRYNWRTKQVLKNNHTNLTALGVYLNTTQDDWDSDSDTWDSDTTRWDDIANLSLNPVVVLGDSAGISTKRGSVSNDNGVAIDAAMDTKEFTAKDFKLPDEDRIMRWKGLQVWALGNGVSVYYSTDAGTTWTLGATLTLSSSYPADSAPLMVYFDTVASGCMLRFANSTLSESFTLKKYQVMAVPREARK